MSRLNKARVLVLSTLLSTCSFTAQAGPGGTGGGQDTVTAFNVNTLDVFNWLKKYGSTLTPPINAQQFYMAADPTHVVPINDLHDPNNPNLTRFREVTKECDGKKPADASDLSTGCYNAHDDKIYLSEARYPTKYTSPAIFGVSAHEVFRRMKINNKHIEGDGYEISRLIPFLKISSADSPRITLINPTADAMGASNVMLPKPTSSGEQEAPPAIYFSNISSNIGINSSGTEVYVADGSACSKAINPHCHNASDILTLSVQSTTPTANTPVMYLLYCGGNAPVVGNPINSCIILAQSPYTDGHMIPTLKVSWGRICAAVNSMGNDDLQPNCTSALYENQEAMLYLAADSIASGQISGEIQPLRFWFTTSIPAMASSNISTGVAGLYDFAVVPGRNAVQITSPQVNASFPFGENTVGIATARFYYVNNFDGGTEYDQRNFSAFGPLNMGVTGQAFDTSVSDNGTLLSGKITLPDHKRYYFKAALVDMAGNVGYLTEDNDGPNHSAVPLQ